MNHCLRVTTSGSTGMPKSALLHHAAFVELCPAPWASDMHRPDDISAAILACTFDVHVFEIFGVLMLGATVVMIKPHGLLDIDYLAKTICKHKATFLPLVPSVAAVFVDAVTTRNLASCLRAFASFVLGGEALPSITCRDCAVCCRRRARSGTTTVKEHSL